MQLSLVAIGVGDGARVAVGAAVAVGGIIVAVGRAGAVVGVGDEHDALMNIAPKAIKRNINRWVISFIFGSSWRDTRRFILSCVPHFT